MFFPEENELLDENLKADTGYFHMSYQSGRPNEYPKQHKLITAQAIAQSWLL